MGLFSGLFSALFRTKKLNADPNQQALAQALLDSVENNGGHATREVFNILTENGWSRSEASTRLAHATSMTRVWRADLHPRVAKLTTSLNEAVYKAF